MKLRLLMSLVVLFAFLPFHSDAFAQKPTAPQKVTLAPAPAVRTTPAPTGITNDQVIKMVKAGLGEEVVISTIKNSAKKSFDLTPDGLIALKTAGVGDHIILAMQGNLRETSVAAVPSAAIPASSPATAPTVVKKVSTSEIGKTREPGIYATQGNKIVIVQNSAASGGGFNGKGLAKNMFSFGLKSAPLEAQINGPKAELRLHPEAEFYFYGTFNPKEFALVKLNSTEDQRTVTTGRMGGIHGSKKGFEKEDVVSVRIDKLENGYKVVPASALERGEYGFVSLADDASQKIWDFGVE